MKVCHVTSISDYMGYGPNKGNKDRDDKNEGTETVLANENIIINRCI